ncbi:MAG: AMP-binding protein [Gemmatimonadales bacterium]
MNPTRRFERARATLLRHRADLDAARSAFAWPELDDFNWAWDWFSTYAGQTDRTALILVRETGDTPETTRVSFRELDERSTRIGRYLADRGVARGDRILLMLPNVQPLWETMLAAIKIGAVVIPATTQLTSEDIDDRIERGRVRHVITDLPGAEKVRNPERLSVRLCTGEAAGFSPFDEALTAAAKLARVATRATDPMLLYFTSGTTAKAKLVLHTHQSYPVGHLTTMFWLGLEEGGVHQNISSPGWAKHAWSSFFAPWNAGATVLVHDTARFSAARNIEVLRQHEVTSLCAPPTVWRMLVLEEMGARPSGLRELASAGEPLNPEIIEHVEARWGLTIRDGYGQTETTALVGNPPGFPIVPGSMGKPLPGYRIVIVDREGKEAAEGEVAVQLTPRPTGLMDGYEGDADRTAAAMADDIYRTGDEARRDEQGYIHFVGRADDVFKSSDYRISPFELESVLIEHDLVAEAAVVPSPDPIRLAVPKAFIVLVPGAEANEAAARAIFAYCSSKLAPYKRIRCLEFSALPKTISGKIRRVELRNQERERRATGDRSPAEFWLDDLK